VGCNLVGSSVSNVYLDTINLTQSKHRLMCKTYGERYWPVLVVCCQKDLAVVEHVTDVLQRTGGLDKWIVKISLVGCFVM